MDTLFARLGYILCPLFDCLLFSEQVVYQVNEPSRRKSLLTITSHPLISIANNYITTVTSLLTRIQTKRNQFYLEYAHLYL